MRRATMLGMGLGVGLAVGVTLIGVLLPQPAFAVSQAGGISLQFPIGSRYNALGEAGTALATDMSAIWWNVGGFAYAADEGKDHGVHFMYSKLAAGLANDVSLNWLGYGQYVEGWGMVGGSITYLNQGEQEGTDIDGNPTENFNAYQFALNLAYGVKLTPNLGTGIGVKYFRDELAPESVLRPGQKGSGATWAVDLGVYYADFLLSGFDTGVSLSNLGPKITFDDEAQSDPMPRTLRIGTAYAAYESSVQAFRIVSDYLISLVEGDRTKVLGVGLEWSYIRSLFVRAGYKSDPEGDIEDATWGFGVDLEEWTGQAITFDYANVPQAKDLDKVNRFSLNFDF